MDLKKYSIVLSIIICILSIPFIWADTNGIWHLAKDVRPGVFGDDENDITNPYEFQNPIIYRAQELDSRYIMDQNGDTVNGMINFLNNVTYKGNDLDERYINALESDFLNGNLGISGSITATEHLYNSDSRLKKNIMPLRNSLDIIKKLNGVSFNWKENEIKDIGFIAQDVEKIIPELVVTNEKTDLKAVKYGNVVPILVEAIKEQQKEIDKLKLEIDKLKNEN